MIAALVALILVVTSSTATAQSSAGGATPPPAPVSSPAPSPAVASPEAPSVPGSAEPAAAPASETPPPTAESMVADTTARDISTASYYELVTWCDELGLDDSGSRADLQNRLAAHYKVTLPAVPAPGRRSVTVRSARLSEYFTEKETGEKYVLLRGDVVVEVKDNKDNTLQTIKAASLTFNQTRRTMSAVGDVTYSLTRGSSTDTFTGESLDFDIDSSEAVFYDGSTRRVVKQAAGDIPYTFSGQTITRVSNDTVIMQKGAITTSETPSDPLYQIRAGTIWLLAPGEWAVQDAVLLLGRTPIIYLPGFFWPGDDFFFNPSIGYKIREGSYLQTTTYLVGRKQKQDSPFSFLQLSNSGDAGYALEPHGLFLRKVPGVAPPKDDGHTLKLMLDGYSRLGAMAGLAGDFSPLSTFRTSVAMSRSIFLDPVLQYYTPYLPQVPASNPHNYSVGEDFWNSSYFLGIYVPFRYGLEGTLKTSAPNTYSLSANFQYFSDPYYTTDFYNRSENGTFSAFLTPPNTTPAAAVPQQTNLSWDLSGNVDFTTLVNKPFIRNLSISNFNVKATWLSNTATGLSDPEASDPGRSFYYPTSVTAPSISANMAGDILSLGTATPAGPAPAPGAAASPPPAAPASSPGASSSAPAASGTTPTTATTTPAASAIPASSASASASAPATTATPASSASASAPAPATPPAAPPAAVPDHGKGVRPLLPDVAPSTAAPPEAAPRIPFRSPDLFSSVAAAISQPATLKVSYQVQPRATLEHTFDTTDWTTRQAVDYRIKYRTFETGGTTNLTAASTFLDNFADSSLTLSTDSLWRYRFNPSPAERESADWPSTLLLDQQQDVVAFRTIFQSTVRPFPAIAELSTSNVQYRINARMYQIGLTPDPSNPYSPSMATKGPAWTQDAISEHSVVSTLAYVSPATTDSLGLTYQLPPLIETLTGKLDLAAGVWSGRVQGGFSSPPTGRQYQPLVVSATMDMNRATTGTSTTSTTTSSTTTGSTTTSTTTTTSTGTTTSTTTSSTTTSTPAPAQNTAFTATEELQFNVESSELTRSTSSLGYAGFSGQFMAQNTGTPNRLEAGTVKIGYESPWGPLWYWKDRIKITPGLKTHWYMNLQNDIDNLLDFSPSLTLTIYNNLDITFSSTSNNTRTYLYFPSLSHLPFVNPLTDLWQSFNFANNDDRRRSGFKIQNVSLKAVQHFPDWDASVEYAGSPQLVTHTNAVGTQYVQIEWSPTFSIQVQWKAFPQVKSNIHQEYTGTTTVPSLR